MKSHTNTVFWKSRADLKPWWKNCSRAATKLLSPHSSTVRLPLCTQDKHPHTQVNLQNTDINFLNDWIKDGRSRGGHPFLSCTCPESNSDPLIRPLNSWRFTTCTCCTSWVGFSDFDSKMLRYTKNLRCAWTWSCSCSRENLYRSNPAGLGVLQWPCGLRQVFSAWGAKQPLIPWNQCCLVHSVLQDSPIFISFTSMLSENPFLCRISSFLWGDIDTSVLTKPWWGEMVQSSQFSDANDSANTLNEF